MLTGKKLILFDLDGTLIDSVGIWNEVDRILIRRIASMEIGLADCQMQRDALLREFRSAPNPYLEYCAWLGRQYAPGMAAEAILRQRVDTAREFLTTVADYKKDAEKLLVWLQSRSLTLVIATTTSRENMNIYRTANRNIRAKAPLDDFFTRVYTRDDVEKIKPDPEVYHKAMREHAVGPEDCLVFEDSLVGVEAANNAGIDVVAMYDAYSDADRERIVAQSAFQFDSYAAVIAALESCRKS
jgi:haloacid dehalogenase superfamily, subfamily IA, variant 3 with third motif having DD or ED